MEESIYSQLLFPDEWQQCHRETLIEAIKRQGFQYTVDDIASFVDFMDKKEIELALIDFIQNTPKIQSTVASLRRSGYAKAQRADIPKDVVPVIARSLSLRRRQSNLLP